MAVVDPIVPELTVLIKVGFGYVPVKSPPAAPDGAVEIVVGT